MDLHQFVCFGNRWHHPDYFSCCYEWIDVRNHQNSLKFFTIVGMNSIFIYLFFIFIGDRWLNGYMEILSANY